MYACYRKEDAADAITMLDAVAAVLANYPENIIRLVTDPRTGLPGKSKWPPNVAEVREACEREMEPIRAAQEREARYAETFRLIASQPRHRMTREQMVEKFGEGWGISASTAKEMAEKRDRHLAELQEANRKVFERECQAVGADPETTKISPALRTQIEQRRQFDESARRSIHQEAAE